MKPRGKTYAHCGLIAKNVEGGAGAAPPPPPPPGLIRVKLKKGKFWASTLPHKIYY